MRHAPAYHYHVIFCVSEDKVANIVEALCNRAVGNNRLRVWIIRELLRKHLRRGCRKTADITKMNVEELPLLPRSTRLTP